MTASSIVHRGLHVLSATAGSGKTRTDQAWIAELVHGGYALSDIAGMSFTRTGALTLAQRVAGVESVSTDDLEQFRTIHSHCYRLIGLRRDQVVTEKHVRQFFQRVKIPYTSGADVDPDDYRPASRRRTPGAALIAFFDWFRSRMLTLEAGYWAYSRALRIPPELMPYWSLPRLRRLFAQYEAFKADANLADFVDMLVLTYENGLMPPVRALVCDEFQDCTTLQAQLVLRWAEQCDAALVSGDGDQLLYGHLGAEPDDFLQWPGERHTLGTNYRSGRQIVRFADRLIRRNRNRIALTIDAARDGGSVAPLGRLPRSLDPTRSAFILARAHYLLDPIAHQLEQQGVPFAMRRGSRGLPSDLHHDAYSAFRATVALRAGRSLTAHQLHQLASFIRGAQYFAHGSKAQIKRLALQDGQQGQPSILIGLGDLPAFGGTASLSTAITHDDPGLLARIEPDRLAYWRRVVRTYGDAVLYETPKIQLSTIHGVKGEEAQDVYLLSDITGRIADSMRSSRAGLEAERRVFYVASTRARERLFVLTPQSALSFSEVMPRRSA